MRNPPEITLSSQTANVKLDLWDDGVLRISDNQTRKALLIRLSKSQSRALAAALAAAPPRKQRRAYDHPPAQYYSRPTGSAGPKPLANAGKGD